MMSIFGNPFCYTPAATQPSFTPLFRLLDEFDSYTGNLDVQRSPLQRQQQRRIRPFRPKFDARETESAYELHGELPGVDRDNLHIEFTDPQTLVVRGRAVRTYDSSKSEQHEPSESEHAQAESGSASVAATSSSSGNNNNNQNHHATVENGPEEEATNPAGFASTETSKSEVANRPKSHVTPAPTDKVWMYERSVGEFSRTFCFPGRVDQDAVSATLENGVLSVVVPKAKKPATRRITVN